MTAILAAIRIIDEEPERRMELIKNARFLAEGLNEKMKKTWDIHTLLKLYPRDLITAY